MPAFFPPWRPPSPCWRRPPLPLREARRLILLLLAPDRAGNPHALARRMGIQEIIWDCGYWAPA